jgi:hypothetical protein
VNAKDVEAASTVDAEAKDVEASSKREAKRPKLSAGEEAEANRIGELVGKFVGELCQEGERAAVVLGAARVDLGIEELLKKILRPNPGGSDDLFEGDRPLSTFSAKIALAYRLSLIENDLERALQLVRRIRNEFAHAHERLTLDQGAAANRLLELKRLCQENSTYSAVERRLKESGAPPQLRIFAQSIGVIIVRLECIQMLSDAYRPNLPGHLKNW